MPIVACVLKSGGMYTRAHVRILEAMVTRHLQIERFVCLSDVDLQLKNVERIPLRHNWPGWWAKCELFTPRLFPAGARVLYLDLDMLIVGDLSDMASRTEPFLIAGDTYRRPPKRPTIGLQSSLMMWTAGETDDIYSDFAKRPAQLMRKYQQLGDQGWIEEKRPNATLWEVATPGQLVSFKKHCRTGLPPNARIVDFHGPQFKPWSSNINWVKRHYCADVAPIDGRTSIQGRTWPISPSSSPSH